MNRMHVFLSKQTYQYRWLVMSFSVWVVLGAYFCYDIPASLHNSLKTHMDNFDGDVFEIYFGGLYSIYAFANIFLPFISGGIRDIMGDRFVIIMLGILVIFGQTVFTFGVIQKSFMIMYFGRILLGWGVESMIPTLTSFISPYYKEDYLAFSVGMNQLFAHIGLVLCMLVCPIIAERQGLIVANTVGIFMNAISFFLGLVAILLDQQAESQMHPYQSVVVKERIQVIRQDTQNSKLSEFMEEHKEEHKEEEQKINPLIKSDIIEVPHHHHHHHEHRPDQQQGFLSHAFDFKHLAEFPRLFWYMGIFYAVIYASVLALVNVSVGFVSETWLKGNENAEREASKMVAVMWFLTGSLTPLFGILIDYLGHRSTISIFAALLCMTGHLLVIANQLFVGLILLGCSLALAFATIWTGIVYVIPADRYGKAFGVIVSMYNAAFTLVPLIVGLLRAYTKTYFLSEVFLALLGLIALIFAILIYHEDHHTGGRIDKGIYVDSESEIQYSSIGAKPRYMRNHSQPVVAGRY